MYAVCGNILIKNMVTAVYAYSGDSGAEQIGSFGGTCGTVTIEPGANVNI